MTTAGAVSVGDPGARTQVATSDTFAQAPVNSTEPTCDPTGPASIDSVASFDGHVLTLRGSIDIYHAQALRLRLIEVLGTHPEDLAIDVSELKRLDAATAQLLLAFRREAPQARILTAPESVRDSLVRVGLWKLL